MSNESNTPETFSIDVEWNSGVDPGAESFRPLALRIAALLMEGGLTRGNTHLSVALASSLEPGDTPGVRVTWDDALYPSAMEFESTLNTLLVEAGLTGAAVVLSIGQYDELVTND